MRGPGETVQGFKRTALSSAAQTKDRRAAALAERSYILFVHSSKIRSVVHWVWKNLSKTVYGPVVPVASVAVPSGENVSKTVYTVRSPSGRLAMQCCGP